MNTLLKIDIKSTIAEGRAQTHQEFKAYNEASKLRIRNRLLACNFSDARIGRIMRHRNGIKQGMKAAPVDWIMEHDFQNRAWHEQRKETTKTLRSMTLAYGFLCDIPYYQMERVCYTNPDWEQVVGFVNVYALAENDQEHGPQRLEQWLQSAQSDQTTKEQVRYDVAGSEGTATVVKPSKQVSITFNSSKVQRRRK